MTSRTNEEAIEIPPIRKMMNSARFSSLLTLRVLTKRIGTTRTR
jgi:hypothetical protein